MLVLLYDGCATAIGFESTGLDLPFQLRWPAVFGVPHHQRNKENLNLIDSLLASW